eukprot:scaffold3354_cov63-Phaeocystis_antarctica.AAC.3
MFASHAMILFSRIDRSGVHSRRSTEEVTCTKRRPIVGFARAYRRKRPRKNTKDSRPSYTQRPWRVKDEIPFALTRPSMQP